MLRKIKNAHAANYTGIFNGFYWSNRYVDFNKVSFIVSQTAQLRPSLLFCPISEQNKRRLANLER